MKPWVKPAIAAVIAGGFLCTGMSLNTEASASAASEASSSTSAAASVFINGQFQSSKNVITTGGRTLIPIRALTDPSWLVFAYDPKTHIVMFHTKDNGITVKLKEDEKSADVNGKRVDIDAAVMNKNGLTYVPLRFIGETLGAYVHYFAADNHIIVRTPSAQAKYEKLLHGDLTEARRIALQLPKMHGDAPQAQAGEGYNYYAYSFPEGEALRFTFSESGYCDSYYEVNEEGFAELKWQFDAVANREWGTKPAFERSVNFLNEFMGGVFTYGTSDNQGHEHQLGRYYRDASDNQVLTIEGEKRIDAKP